MCGLLVGITPSFCSSTLLLGQLVASNRGCGIIRLVILVLSSEYVLAEFYGLLVGVSKVSFLIAPGI